MTAERVVDFHLPEPISRDRRPDIAFVSYGQWAKNRPLAPTDDAWDVIPNLAVEVVSPNDTADEIEQKIAEYFCVYSSPMQIRGVSKVDLLDGGNVVPGFQLRLAELFTEPA
jgi:hypothetical protein